MSTYTFFTKVKDTSFEVLIGADPALRRKYMVVYAGSDEQLVYSNLDDKYLAKNPDAHKQYSYFLDKAKELGIVVPQHLIDYLNKDEVLQQTPAQVAMLRKYIEIIHKLSNNDSLTGDVFATRRCARIEDALKYGQKCSYSDAAGFIEDWVYTDRDNDANIIADSEVNFGIPTSMMEKIMGMPLQGLLEPSEQNVFDKEVSELHFGKEISSESIVFILESKFLK